MNHALMCGRARAPWSLVYLLVIAVLLSGFSSASSSADASQSPRSANVPGRVTFTRDVAPIVFAHCAFCHRPGEIGPFSLLTYDDLKGRAASIARVTAQRVMPPWKPEPGKGEFLGQRRLTDDQIRTIQEWVAQGAVEGDSKDLPPLPAWKEGWQLGTPDLVVSMPVAYQLQADGTDVFRTFVLPIPLTTPRYVRALEFRPGNRRVVHHANIGVDRRRRSRRPDPLDSQPGYPGAMMPDATPEGQLLGWTPGQIPHPAHPGASIAWRLEPGSDLVVQAHLQPNGKPEPVQVSVGFFFTNEAPPDTAPTLLRMGSQSIDIPSGERNYVITDSYDLPVDVTLLAIQPHAHYLGRQMEATATLPDGSTRWLISIRDWDFRFQDVYRYVEPVSLPKGTRLSMRFTYDNSAENTRNPHRTAPQHVLWGPKTFDEMGDLWLQVVARRSEDAATLAQDFRRKTYAEDLAANLRLLQADPADPLKHDVVGALYLESGRNHDAIPHFRESLRINPASAAAHYNLGLALSRQGNTEEALTQFEDAARLDPGYSEAHNNLSVLLPLFDRMDAALTHARRAVELSPENFRAHTNLGRILWAKGEMSEAIKELRLALSLNGNWVPALGDLGWILATSSGSEPRDSAEAVVRAERAATLTDYRDPSVLDLLAAAYASAGRFDLARSTAQTALNMALGGGMRPLADAIRQRSASYERGEPVRGKRPFEP